MIPRWLGEAAFLLVALMIAGALLLVQEARWACLWLALCLCIGYLHQKLMLSRLSDWTALPEKRDLRALFLGKSAWRLPFEKLQRRYKLLREEMQALRAELSNVHTAVDKLEDALVVLDKYSHIEWANDRAKQLFGFMGSSGVHRPIHHFLRDPRFSEMLDSQFHAVAGHTKSLQLTLSQQPGATFHLQLTKSEDERQLLIVRDVTEQAKLDAVKSDFIANISHEIRTPLTVVSGYTETLLELDLSPSEQRKHLETILKQSRTMQSLVSDLLTLSALEQEVDKTDEQSIEVSKLFADLQAEANMLSADQHEISFSIEHGALIRCLVEELYSATRNLMSNAIRYTPAGGKIKITFRFQNNIGRLTVQDTGLGIEAKHLPRLTERFYRVDRGRSRGDGGTGLGLAIVKRIANRHQMELEIESRIGEGSTFTLLIPAERLVFTQAATRNLALV